MRPRHIAIELRPVTMVASATGSTKRQTKAVGLSLRAPRCLKVGTDFSGMDAAAVAFKDLAVHHKLMFASDRHKPCRTLVVRLHKPAKFFDNVLLRAPETEDYVDVYVWGPPCQSFSTAGKNKGVQDRAARHGTPWFKLIQL